MTPETSSLLTVTNHLVTQTPCLFSSDVCYDRKVNCASSLGNPWYKLRTLGKGRLQVRTHPSFLNRGLFSDLCLHLFHRSRKGSQVWKILTELHTRPWRAPWTLPQGLTHCISKHIPQKQWPLTDSIFFWGTEKCIFSPDFKSLWIFLFLQEAEITL